MDKTLFLDDVKETLQREDELAMDSVLEDLEEWDSLGIMMTVVMLEKKYKVKTTVIELQKYKTLQEIYDKVNQE